MADLAPLTGEVKSRPFLVLDLESKDGDSDRAGFTRPFLAGVYDGENYTANFDQSSDGDWERRYYYPGGCVDRMMRQILVKRYRGHHIYAHNAGRFDYLFILPWLMGPGSRLGYRFQIIPVSSSIQVLDVWHVSDRMEAAAKKLREQGKEFEARKVLTVKWRRWRFLDSFKLIPTSLDKAAKGFGLSGKLKHDLDLSESDPRWVEYNQQDCVELYRVIERFHHYIERVLLGEVGITAPATSVKLFRRRFLKNSIPRSEDTHAFVRDGYFGGRVEVFRKYGEKLHYFDINSSYPRAMLERMPVGQGAHWEGEPPKRFQKSWIGFVEASVHVPEGVHIPPLPIRATKDLRIGVPEGKLIFPVGNVMGIWEWSELELALELGCTIQRWHRSVWYEPGPLFEEFVHELYRYRDKSQPDYDPGLAEVVKIMLNSAYGKFGMRTMRRKIHRYDDPELPENAVPVSGDPDSLIWISEEEVDAPYIMPQIAARVTALARVQLYRAMQMAMKRRGDLYYCDTDSVVTDVVLPTSSELGALKDEGIDWAKSLDADRRKRGEPSTGLRTLSGHLKGEFIGPKLYLLSTPDGFSKVKAKGLERKKKKPNGDEMSAVEREEALLSDVRRLEKGEKIFQKRLEKVGTLARAGFERGPRLITVPRRILPDQGKRRMLEDGSTEPYYVRMW